MSFSSSYLQLDGVEFKISDVVNPPAIPTLPKEFKMKDISELLSDSKFDFTLETTVLAKISSVREAEKRMAEKEEQRKMQSMKRRGDAEKCRLEEMMSQQREVLQRKREEFLEQKRKKKQNEDDISPGSSSPTDISNASRVSPTYENLEAPPKIPARNPFSSGQDGILTPQPVVGKTAESTTKLNQSQPVVSGQNQIWEDFEDKELDPFTNAELKTIDDLAELQAVLQNARIGQGLGVTSHSSTTKQDQCATKPTNQIMNHTTSPSSENCSEDTQISAPLYENISLQEVNDIVTKLEKQDKDLLEKTQNESSISTKSTPGSEQNTTLTSSNTPEPVYSKVHKKQTGNNQPKPVEISLNPNNPFLSTSGFGPTNASQLASNFHTSIQPLPGFSPSLEETSVSQSSLYANLFNPVSTGFYPSNVAVSTTSNSSSSSPVFDRMATSQSGISNPASDHVGNSTASKVLPVSFGPMSTPVTAPNLPGSSNNQHANIPQNARVPHKPPIPAPRKPAIPPRQSPSFTSTALNGAPTSTDVHNVTTKGHAHLLPPYAIPNSSEANSIAPSSDYGYIKKSKQDRAKFAETVNKALSSLPQNPAPVKKKTENKTPTNHETQPTPAVPVTRNLSLKSSLIAGLTAKEQTFVKNMMSMGFEGEATVRAMQQFGLDDKEVLDHLIQVQSIMEQGYHSRTVQDALEMFPKDGKSVVMYLTKFQQLADMGFPEDKVRDALKTHDNDQAKALDQLMEAT